jgi:hypothetical protein
MRNMFTGINLRRQSPTFGSSKSLTFDLRRTQSFNIGKLVV